MSEGLTRAELYELVWAEPIRLLAKRFGISDVALAKRCRAANIPIPGRGFWAKVESGKRVDRPDLPARGFGQSDRISFGREERRTYAEENEELLRTELVPPAPFPDGFDDVLARARQTVGKVSAIRSLEKPHEAIARLLAEDEKRREKQKASKYPSSFDNPLFDSPFERRRLAFMSSLFRALDRVGCRPRVHGREATDISIAIGEERLSLKLGPAKPPPHSYPPKVLQAGERMKLDLGWYQPPPEVKVTWEDDGRNRLEAQLVEIVPHLVADAEWAYRNGIERRYQFNVERKRELQEKIRREAEEAERKEQARLVKIATDRRNQLVANARAWREAADIRSYVSARLAQGKTRLDPEALRRLEKWAAWASEEANQIDPMRRDEPEIG